MSPLRKRGKQKPAAGSPRQAEAGYTLLLALFIAAVMIIAASAAIPNLITQSRRQKEKLMIWRGRQYARAIGLYYRKTGHFPHDLEQLEKGVAGLHFLRQPYKDPMNTQDGSWRLIYLGAGGQLIGSLCWRTLAEYEAAQKGVPFLSTPTATPGSPFTGALTPLGAEGATGKQKKPTVPTCGMFGKESSNGPTPQVITEGAMIGGNLVGVAGRVDAPSIKNYMGADNYRYWEFIWNPHRGSRTMGSGGALPAGQGFPGAPTPKSPTQPGAPAPPAPTLPPLGSSGNQSTGF